LISERKELLNSFIFFSLSVNIFQSKMDNPCETYRSELNKPRKILYTSVDQEDDFNTELPGGFHRVALRRLANG